MYKRILFLSSLVFVFGFSSISYAKVIDLYLNTKGAAVVSQDTDYKGVDGDKSMLEDYDDAAIGIAFGINFKIVSGLYLGIQYSFEDQYGDEETSGSDEESYNTEVQQIIPTVGWKFPTFARFLNIFVELGIGVWDKVDVDKEKYDGDGEFLDVDVDISTYLAVGLNFQIVKWFSMYIKHSSAYYKQTYKLDGNKAETTRTYFTFEFGPMFSF